VRCHRRLIPVPDGIVLLSQGYELPEPSMLPSLQQKAVKILLVGTDRPADEGNILCFRRTSDSIRWIVYELRDGKVEPERGRAGIIAEPS
jgi:hypothetical protein